MCFSGAGPHILLLLFVHRFERGWGIVLLLCASPRKRLPHPSRFSKGGNLGREYQGLRRPNSIFYYPAMTSGVRESLRIRHPLRPLVENRDEWGSLFRGSLPGCHGKGGSASLRKSLFFDFLIRSLQEILDTVPSYRGVQCYEQTVFVGCQTDEHPHRRRQTANPAYCTRH